MNQSSKSFISVIVPVFNEQAGIAEFHGMLEGSLKKTKLKYEIIYCNDGSSDDSLAELERIAKRNKHVRIISLSRNFGKEVATTAGIHQARGDALITIDADGQHPVELLPQFLAKWRAGSKVVIGLRTTNSHAAFMKRLGSNIFYRTFNRLTGLSLISGSTDYRLIDRTVQQEFKKMTEHNRITRGLIDWLGYQRDYVEFEAHRRLAGEVTYTFRKLSKLAVDSVISLSLSPLYITAYIGAVVLPLAALLGVAMVINALLSDPFNLHITGGAYLLVTLLFLIGALLMSQGIIGLYLSHIHTETQNRPLYVIDQDRSVRLRAS